MKDTYPQLDTLPANHLVVDSLQPEYSKTPLPDWVAECNVGHALSDAQVALGRGDLIAALQGDSDAALTFAELAEQSTALARALVKMGIKPGDRVAYQSPNAVELIVVMLAIWKAGGIVVPIPTYADTSCIYFFIADTGARFVFLNKKVETLDVWQDISDDTKLDGVVYFGATNGNIAGLEESGFLTGAEGEAMPEVSPDQPAIIWHTGGTTGQPKSCYHTHRRFLLGGLSFGKTAKIEPGLRVAVMSPMGHALGLIHNTIFCMLHGATPVLLEQFSDANVVLNAIETHRINMMTGLMASWGKLAAHIKENAPEADTSSLKTCFAMWQSASSAEVFDFWRDRGVELLNNFGSTSFATWVLIPPVSSQVPRSALGMAAEDFQIEAVELRDGKVHPLPKGEIGVLAVKGPTGLTYWNRHDLQERDVQGGWTLADDLIRFDEDGFVHYLGRSDYLISTGGFKVAPGEVETVLSRHDLVQEVAVVPAPCAKMLQKVVAYVAVSKGAAGSKGLKRELVERAKSELSYYKVPREIVFVDALPRDALGKIQTKIVQSWASEAFALT